MDHRGFDRTTRRLATTRPRRSVLQGLAAGALAAVGVVRSVSAQATPTGDGICPPRAVDFSSLNLAKADLSGRDLSNVKFMNTDLTNAVLDAVNLTGADLTGANLSAASLTHANLSNATLTNANLAETDSRAVNLTSGDLTGANLSYAFLSEAKLAGVIWSNTTCPDGSNSDANGGTCCGHVNHVALYDGC